MATIIFSCIFPFQISPPSLCKVFMRSISPNYFPFTIHFHSAVIKQLPTDVPLYKLNITRRDNQLLAVRWDGKQRASKQTVLWSDTIPPNCSLFLTFFFLHCQQNCLPKTQSLIWRMVSCLRRAIKSTVLYYTLSIIRAFLSL